MIMEDKGADLVTAFDTAYTNNRIRMLKILFSRLPAAQQPPVALCIRYLELQYVWRLKSVPAAACPSDHQRLSADFFSGDPSGSIDLLNELLPYGTPSERARIEGMKSMLANLGRMKEMMETIQLMKELFPEGFGGDDESPADLLSGMAGISGMDMSALFSMFGKENGNE